MNETAHGDEVWRSESGETRVTLENGTVHAWARPPGGHTWQLHGESKLRAVEAAFLSTLARAMDAESGLREVDEAIRGIMARVRKGTP